MADSYQISVIVCTFNRDDLLPLCLESLCNQSLQASQYEILVVDNASTDNTSGVVREFQSKFPQHHIHYIYETTQGLGYARNRGFREARSPFVAYADDDAIADRQWLEKALDLITNYNPAPICVGGIIGTFYTANKPVWFKDVYELRTFGEEQRLLQKDESFSGSNMIWTKALLEQFGGFSVDKGVFGNLISVGEEAALFLKIWRTLPNPIFVYDPQLIVHHYVAPIKFSLLYRNKRAIIAGQVLGENNAIANQLSRLTRTKIVLKQCYFLLRTSIKAVLSYRKHQHWQSWAVEELYIVFYKIGYILGMIGIKPIKLNRN